MKTFEQVLAAVSYATLAACKLEQPPHGKTIHACIVVFSVTPDGEMDEHGVGTTFGNNLEGMGQCADILMHVSSGDVAPMDRDLPPYDMMPMPPTAQ